MIFPKEVKDIPYVKFFYGKELTIPMLKTDYEQLLSDATKWREMQKSKEKGKV